MINTVIFDIGNVLADFTWKEFINGKGYMGTMFDRIVRASIMNDNWVEYDKGLISDEEIIQLFVDSDPEIEADIRKCFAEIKGMVSKNDYAIPWINELKKRGYRVYYLSNFSRKAEVECADALDFIPYMDGGILSYKEHLVKPMPQIYELLIQRYNLNPKECVFLDDTEINLTGASGFGIHTILFKNYEQAKDELERILAEC